MSEVRYGPDLRVLVVGGGVAGLTLCGLLRRRGFRPRLVEARGPGYETRRDHVLGVWPSGTDVLKGLGLYDHLAGAGQELRAYVVADERGTTVRRYDLRPAGRRFGPAYLLPRSGFLEALRAGPRRHARVPRERPCVASPSTPTRSRSRSPTARRTPSTSSWARTA